MLTDKQKELVQSTWELVVPIADTAAALFYGRLFEIAPQLRPMFAHAEMSEQGKKLMQMITVAVRGLGNAFTPEAECAWGVTYGVLAKAMQDAAREVELAA